MLISQVKQTLMWANIGETMETVEKYLITNIKPSNS